MFPSLTIVDDLGDNFDIKHWLISIPCQKVLNDFIAADTYNIDALPVYDIDHTLLPPSKYMEKLPGATTLVSLAFAHHHIKASQHHIFNTTCHELMILWNVDQLPSFSPYKNRHVCCKPLLNSDDEFDTNKAASSSFQGVYMLSFVSFPALGMNFKGGSSQVWMRIFKHEVMRCWLPV